jgi:hypothetical protein
VAQLYSEVLGSIFVASQGYGGVNRTRPATGRTENVTSIIAYSLVAGETTCPQGFSVATAVVLSPVYTAANWQWLHMSQYCSSEAYQL